MTISAALVKELRERTGAGMMECKKALVETNGDIDAAIDVMRKSGQAKADKKAGRVAAEGIIIILRSTDNKQAVILEVNSETDFVARDENFVAFANKTAQAALANKIKDVAALAKLDLGEGTTVEQARTQLVAKVGENITVRRIEFIETDATIGEYIHGGRIGVVVLVKNGDAELVKDLAMHIAANNPVVVSPEDVSAEKINKEKEIFMAQAENSGKPADIIEKMVTGRIKKFVNEISLLGQPFVKDPNVTVGKLIESKGANVLGFVRFAVGEGIEKEETNFADEVMAQVKESQ